MGTCLMRKAMSRLEVKDRCGKFNPLPRRSSATATRGPQQQGSKRQSKRQSHVGQSGVDGILWHRLSLSVVFNVYHETSTLSTKMM